MTQMEYAKPRSFKELDGIFESAKGPLRFIAGGTNVVPDLRAGTISPRLLVDLSGLKEMAYIREVKGEIAIGALSTISDILASRVICDKAPLLFQAARHLGSPLTRNRATIGGNLADASPAADTAPPLLAMGAMVHTRRRRGKERTIPLDRFFLGPNKTILAKDEIITRITFAKPKDPSRGRYLKLGLRNAMTISVASLAVSLEPEGSSFGGARIGLGAVAPTPVRAYLVEKKLASGAMDPKNIEACAQLITKEISPISDIRASADYRKRVVAVLFQRAIQAAVNGGTP